MAPDIRTRRIVDSAKKIGVKPTARRYRITPQAVHYHLDKANGRDHAPAIPDSAHRRVLEAIALLRKAIACRPTDNALHPYDAYVVLALDTLQGGEKRPTRA